jgi:hypothetical protein
MECIQELDERVEEVISENNQYKQLNDELHKQLAL